MQENLRLLQDEVDPLETPGNFQDYNIIRTVFKILNYKSKSIFEKG
jgi:hypothetical protein